MALRLRLKTESPVPLEVEGVTPCAMAELSLSEVRKMPIFQGNQQASLADFFDVQGDPADLRQEWEGNLAGVHWLGAKMTRGEVVVRGSVGRHLGSEMRSGAIHVHGDAGDWVGGEMHGGLIHVRGDAGHLAGAAYRGSARGMSGGTILIQGDAGNEVGHTMRRGLLAVGGKVGDLAGFNMLAGTVLLFGASGIRHGAGMRRGTLAFLAPEGPPMLPSFRRACRYRPEVMTLLLRLLQRHDFPVPEDLARVEFDLYNGDLIEGGRGEILIRA